jgi:serine/threonine protein kinase/tetratricopeptide (TPR) repeat protein
MSRIKAIFLAASAAPAGPQRDAILDEKCDGDAALRREVESLLAAQSTIDVVASGNAPVDQLASTLSTSITEGPGSRIGPYKLLQQIGEGGFGAVFMADQERPVRRRLALKIIKLGMDTRQVVARFEAERQALAMMDHPNIARVLDAGATDSGRPYFVMELVKGDPITKYCDRNNLNIAERLDLFTQVCNAVQHAHTKGVIHRDLKPSNILVSTQDGHPHAKVIDFGIAKATDQHLTDKTLFTEHGALIGTPAYMSPEQAEGSMDIDTRADVYALGVLLYELLTGTTPFDNQQLRAAAFAEVHRIIREVDPPRPSTRLTQSGEAITTLAARRRTEPRRLHMLVRGELDWIAMKALDKDRARRYETASAFAHDVNLHLRGEPVQAAPPSALYRMRKFVRRHRGPVIAAMAVSLTLIAGLVGTGYGFKEARQRAREAVAARDAEAAQRQLATQSARQAQTEASRAREVLELMNRMLESASPDSLRGPDFTLRQLLDDFSEEIMIPIAAEPLVEATVRRVIAKAYLSMGLTDQAEPQLDAAFAWMLRHLEPNHPDMLAVQDDYAVLFHHQQHFDSAVNFLADNVQARRSVREPDSAALAESLFLLAHNLLHLDRWRDAEAPAREAAELWSRAGSEHWSQLAEAWTTLATIAEMSGDFEEARRLRNEIQNLAQQHATELDQLQSGFRLTWGSNWMGRNSTQAAAVLETAIPLVAARIGGDHPRVAEMRKKLAVAYRMSGRFADAREVLLTALADDRKAQAPGRFNEVFTILLLTEVLRDDGRLTEAMQYCAQGLELCDAAPDCGISTRANLLFNSALIHRAAGNLVEAESVLQKIITVANGKLEGETWVQQAEEQLVSMYLQSGRALRAEVLARANVEKARLVYGPGAWQIERARIRLGECLTELKRYADAERALLTAHAALSPMWPANDPEVAAARNGLARLYDTWALSEPTLHVLQNSQIWRRLAAESTEARMPPRAKP